MHKQFNTLSDIDPLYTAVMDYTQPNFSLIKELLAQGHSPDRENIIGRSPRILVDNFYRYYASYELDDQKQKMILQNRGRLLELFQNYDSQLNLNFESSNIIKLQA